MGDQVRKRGFGGARQDEEQSRGEGQDAERDDGGQHSQARVEALQPVARGDRGAAHRAADLARGEGGDGEKQIERQEQEEIEIDGEDGGGKQFEKRDDGGIKIIAIAAAR